MNTAQGVAGEPRSECYPDINTTRVETGGLNLRLVHCASSVEYALSKAQAKPAGSYAAVPTAPPLSLIMQGAKVDG